MPDGNGPPVDGPTAGNWPVFDPTAGCGPVPEPIAGSGPVAGPTGGSGPVFVQGGNTGTFAAATAADGTMSFSVDGTAVSLSGGALAGSVLALEKAAQIRGDLDAIADQIIAVANTAQGNGVDIDGNAGQPLFTGSGAGGIAAAFSNGALLATAAASEPAGSRDSTNLSALRAALASSDPAGDANSLLFDISSAVASRKITHEALDTIASSARIALEQQAGVDLDTEATNLIRFQQAFQASGRAMQRVATPLAAPVRICPSWLASNRAAGSPLSAS